MIDIVIWDEWWNLIEVGNYAGTKKQTCYCQNEWFCHPKMFTCYKPEESFKLLHWKANGIRSEASNSLECKNWQCYDKYLFSQILAALVTSEFPLLVCGLRFLEERRVQFMWLCTSTILLISNKCWVFSMWFLSLYLLYHIYVTVHCTCTVHISSLQFFQS